MKAGLTTQFALNYYNKGMCILPVIPNQKRPILNQWRQYITNRPSIEETENWFSTYNNCGIGMVTGRVSGYIVLDIENKYKGDVNQLLSQYPTKLVAKSGSGGYHFYYKYPKDYDKPIKNRVQIMPNIDIRADGGFIVLPPTKHPSGGYYQWVLDGEAGDFPMSLLSINASGIDNTNDNKWVTELLKGVDSGERNQACARLAGYFFGKGLSNDIVESMLLEWNTKNNPPMDYQEIISTIDSVSRYHTSITSPVKSIEFVQEGEAVSPQPTNFNVLKMKDYFQQYGSEGVQWLVQDWLSEKSITFIVAPPESYKTWLLMDLAVSVASGMPFLGVANVYKTGSVILIQQEDSHAGITERLGVVIESKLGLNPTINGEEYSMPILPDLPIYVHPDRMLKFSDKKVMSDLESMVKELKPALVIIDPLYSATSMENYMADSTTDMFQLKRLRDKYGCSFIIAHHSKKNINDDSLAREDGWGSQFLNAFLEAGWQIRRSPKIAPNEIIVRRHSKTMGNIPPMLIKFDISTKLPFKYNNTVSEYTQIATVKKIEQEKTDDILELLNTYKGGMTSSEIALKLNKHRSTMTRKIQKLISDGIVVRLPDGKIISNITTED